MVYERDISRPNEIGRRKSDCIAEAQDALCPRSAAWGARTVSNLSQSFEERLQEIDAYLDLLDAFERQTQNGPPQIGGGPITAQQQKILYSAVYLHLYNLVEATMVWCLEAVAAAAAKDGQWLPADLTDELRREWIRTTGRTHTELNSDNRLTTTIELCNLLIESVPISEWKFERRGAGSWDDHQIEDMAGRIGCPMYFTPQAISGIKRKIRDDKTALALIRDFRNRLAHGSLSFTECGDGATVIDLRMIKEWTADYLRQVVDAFEQFIDSHGFITSAKRPVIGGET